MILQLQTLIDTDACPNQCDLFREKFGSSVDVTPELCESVAKLFDFDWAAEHLLSASALADYWRVAAMQRAIDNLELEQTWEAQEGEST